MIIPTEHATLIYSRSLANHYIPVVNEGDVHSYEIMRIKNVATRPHLSLAIPLTPGWARLVWGNNPPPDPDIAKLLMAILGTTSPSYIAAATKPGATDVHIVSLSRDEWFLEQCRGPRDVYIYGWRRVYLCPSPNLQVFVSRYGEKARRKPSGDNNEWITIRGTRVLSILPSVSTPSTVATAFYMASGILGSMNTMPVYRKFYHYMLHLLSHASGAGVSGFLKRSTGGGYRLIIHSTHMLLVYSYASQAGILGLPRSPIPRNSVARVHFTRRNSALERRAEQIPVKSITSSHLPLLYYTRITSGKRGASTGGELTTYNIHEVVITAPTRMDLESLVEEYMKRITLIQLEGARAASEVRRLMIAKRNTR